ncbi:hypothetical protein [Exiguobacterium acetylicum]|uniref:hypothetical protein n=1 Tax=Exiguobacterium acetylicum TaxID=41170 RepID=UPI0011EF72B1|nr:hypothetical protein [Exiguobacterium acetylicum]
MYNYVIYNDSFKGLDELFFLDIASKKNVKLIKREDISKFNLINTICKAHLSHKINNIVDMPFKSIWYSKLFNFSNLDKEKLCFIFTPGWYYPDFISYLKRKFPESKFVFYFSDTIESKMRKIKALNIDYLKSNFDLVLSYNQKDVNFYGLKYSPIYYSKVSEEKISKLNIYPKSDVVFIGAARNRIKEIEDSFKLFKSAGVSCFFYVVINEGTITEEIEGIVYSKEIMPFNEYLSRTFSAKCILEILDSNTEGSTLRFWEAIMYNKKLITNYPHAYKNQFYDPEFIQYFKEINSIDTDFIKKNTIPDYKYNNQNSPIKFLEFIESELKI